MNIFQVHLAMEPFFCRTPVSITWNEYSLKHFFIHSFDSALFKTTSDSLLPNTKGFLQILLYLPCFQYYIMLTKLSVLKLLPWIWWQWILLALIQPCWPHLPFVFCWIIFHSTPNYRCFLNLFFLPSCLLSTPVVTYFLKPRCLRHTPDLLSHNLKKWNPSIWFFKELPSN